MHAPLLLAPILLGILLGGCEPASTGGKVPFHRRAPLEAGLPPLLAASYAGRTSDVRALLKRGLVDSVGPSGLTALHLATTAEISGLLLDAGASPNAQDDLGFTALHLAQNAELAQLLMKHGASPSRRSLFGWTPVHTAAILGRPKVLEVILDQGGSVNAQSRNGATPLHLASSQAVANVLVARGANLTQADRWGRTPLDMAQPGEPERGTATGSPAPERWRTVARVRVKAQSKQKRWLALMLLFALPVVGLLAHAFVKEAANRRTGS